MSKYNEPFSKSGQKFNIGETIHIVKYPKVEEHTITGITFNYSSNDGAFYSENYLSKFIANEYAMREYPAEDESSSSFEKVISLIDGEPENCVKSPTGTPTYNVGDVIKIPFVGEGQANKTGGYVPPKILEHRTMTITGVYDIMYIVKDGRKDICILQSKTLTEEGIDHYKKIQRNAKEKENSNKRKKNEEKTRQKSEHEARLAAIRAEDEASRPEREARWRAESAERAAAQSKINAFRAAQQATAQGVGPTSNAKANAKAKERAFETAWGAQPQFSSIEALQAAVSASSTSGKKYCNLRNKNVRSITQKGAVYQLTYEDGDVRESTNPTQIIRECPTVSGGRHRKQSRRIKNKRKRRTHRHSK